MFQYFSQASYIEVIAKKQKPTSPFPPVREGEGGRTDFREIRMHWNT